MSIYYPNCSSNDIRESIKSELTILANTLETRDDGLNGILGPVSDTQILMEMSTLSIRLERAVEALSDGRE